MTTETAETTEQQAAPAQKRKGEKFIEYRSAQMRASDPAEGVFEGYALTWDTLDSYGSMFRRGAAKKTLAERAEKIKVLWNHSELIGRVLEAREDEHGLFVRCRLTLEVQRAREVRALMLDGAVDTMSFGFDTLKEHVESGARVIDEIRLWEVSPVVFAANERTSIESVRSTDFGETMGERVENVTGFLLFESLSETLADIAWQSPGDVAAVDKAIGDFHAAYVAWFAKVSETDEQRAAPNALAATARAVFGTTSADKIAEVNPITAAEARQLLRGKVLGIGQRSRLALISPELAAAHAATRAEIVAELFDEIRAGGFTDAERVRLSALLDTRDKSESGALSAFVDSVTNYANQLKG